ncbi:MAG TPA: PQQ-binding-like beta-propeller repeat protein, partial [Gemmataceae bacterium]|nr:PQQ-binding-like beta-propeller repeat protein [Gemmataceae bacterium]
AAAGGRAGEPPAAATGLVNPGLTPTPDLLFVTGADGTVLALDARTLKSVREWKADGLDAFAASARGDRMATAHKNAVSCAPTNRATPDWTVKVAGDPKVESIHFVDADTLAVVVGIDNTKGKEGRIILLAAKNGAEKRSITFPNDYITNTAGAEGWDRLAVSYQAPAGPAGEDRIALINLATGKRVWDERAVSGTFLGGLDPKRARAAAYALGADYEVHSIDLGTGKVAAKAQVGEQFVSDPVYTPDGRYVLVRGKGERLSVIDAATMKVVGERAWPGLQRFAVSPDGKLLYMTTGEAGASDTAKVVAVGFAEFLGGLQKAK